jgi:hypothetical protein
MSCGLDEAKGIASGLLEDRFLFEDAARLGGLMREPIFLPLFPLLLQLDLIFYLDSEIFFRD